MYQTKVQNAQMPPNCKVAGPQRPFGYLIPEDLYVQVGAR